MSARLPPLSTSMNSVPRLLELSAFRGESAEGWSAENYVELNNLSSPQRNVWSVVASLKNDTVFWYCHRESWQRFCNWEEFRILLVEMQGYFDHKEKRKKERIYEQFLHLNFEDKVRVWGASNVWSFI